MLAAVAAGPPPPPPVERPSPPPRTEWPRQSPRPASGPPSPAVVPRPAHPPSQPRPAVSSGVSAMPVLVGLVMVVLVGLGVLFVSTTNGNTSGSSPAEVGGGLPAYPAPTTALVPVTTTVPAPVDDSSARLALARQVSADRPAAERLVESWVPQLSSKRLGLVVNGLSYDHLAVWQDFSAIKARYPDALLLWSADFVSYDRGDFWVTVVPLPANAGAQANAWCDAQGIGVDDCYAKRLTHTGGSAGTTLLRK